jgi:uncharacterized protein
LKNSTSLYEKFLEKGRLPDCPVYDMHAHMGEFRGIYFPVSGPEEMISGMDRAGVKMAVFSHHLALSSPDAGNASSVDAARRYPDRFKAYCVVNPNYPELAERTMEDYSDLSGVYAGLKLHPDAHKIALTDSRYAGALEFAEKRGLLVLSHTWGGSAYCGAGHVKEIAKRYGNLKLILGHSIHGQWDEAAAIAAEHDNVYLELCAVLDERAGIVEKFVSAAGSEKILFGTDFPWFDYHYYIAGVAAAKISDEDRFNIFYRNAKKLLEIKT